MAAFVLVMPSEGRTLRTPDGQPDLRGIWTNATLTPFERPAEFSGRATFTGEEAAAMEKQRVKTVWTGRLIEELQLNDSRRLFLPGSARLTNRVFLLAKGFLGASFRPEL